MTRMQASNELHAVCFMMWVSIASYGALPSTILQVD